MRAARVWTMAVLLFALGSGLAACKVRKPVYARDLMFTTIKAAGMNFQGNVPVQGYHFAYTTPDKKGKFAIRIAPVESMKDVKLAHPAIKTFLKKHFCPKYKNSKGQFYNFGVYSPATVSGSSRTSFAPIVRKERKDAVLVGWCTTIIRNR